MPVIILSLNFKWYFFYICFEFSGKKNTKTTQFTLLRKDMTCHVLHNCNINC